jgi:hypothetical protein
MGSWLGQFGTGATDGSPRGTCLRPGAKKVSGSQTNLLTPWYDGQAEIIPFRYLPVLDRKTE